MLSAAQPVFRAGDQSLAEKILYDLENAIERNADIAEFAIIPVIDHQNKSPVVYEQRNLGLESWCVKHVYSYAYSKLIEMRDLYKRKYLPAETEKSLNRLLMAALLINPDVTTFWNMKRELVERNINSAETELSISALVLSHKSKSNEAFAFRRWIINRMLESSPGSAAELLSRELSICSLTAERCLNNYHAWTHRSWAVSRLGAGVASVIAQELKFSEIWISRHVSEHTSFYYRQFVLNQVPHCHGQIPAEAKHVEALRHFLPPGRSVDPSDVGQVLRHFFDGPTADGLAGDPSFAAHFAYLLHLLHELRLVQELSGLYGEHESLWYHRRFAVHHLLAFVAAALADQPQEFAARWKALSGSAARPAGRKKLLDTGETSPKLLKTNQERVFASGLYKAVVRAERKAVSAAAARTARHKEFADRHREWMKAVLGMVDV